MTHGGERALLAAAMVLMAGAAGCSGDKAAPSAAGTTTSASASSPAPATSTTPAEKFDIAPPNKEHPDGKMVGAPFDDPCTLLTPNDIPAEFHTADNRNVLRAKPIPEEGTATSCDFGHYEGVGGNPKKASAVSIGWNTRSHVPDISDDPGWKAKTINGRKAIYHHNETADGTKPLNNCSLFMNAPKGVVVLTTRMSSFPAKDACAAVMPMADKVSHVLH